MNDKNITHDMDKWVFNNSVSDVFDEMLSRSIPSYNRMRYLVNQIVINYVKKNKLNGKCVFDLGCSTGEQILLLSDFLESNFFYGFECSEPMIREAEKKCDCKENIKILNLDIIKDEFPVEDVGVILSILTLQFVPIEYRQFVMKKIYDSLDFGGLFIFVEKIIGDNYEFSELYEKLYYDMKYYNGYSWDEIRDKKLKLEGVLVPANNEFNMMLLKQAGFSKIDIFWKDLNFIGYVAIK